MKVQQMISSNGNKIANQFCIDINGTKVFQSYNSIIVKIEKGTVYLDSKFWNYSKTTSKYRNQFLGETTKQIESKIKSGVYLLTNLNGL
jgi:hypothetical protein